MSSKLGLGSKPAELFTIDISEEMNEYLRSIQETTLDLDIDSYLCEFGSTMDIVCEVIGDLFKVPHEKMFLGAGEMDLKLAAPRNVHFDELKESIELLLKGHLHVLKMSPSKIEIYGNGILLLGFGDIVIHGE